MLKLIGAMLAFALVALFFGQLANATAPLRDRLSLKERFLVAVVMTGCDAGVVTLADAQVGTTDDVDLMVIDEFRKSSWLLDNMSFDDAVNPAGGGATLTYGYTRLITQPTAGFRAINAEYTPQEVTRQRYTVDLKPLGGSFQIDRVLSNLGPAASNEVTLQMQQKIKASRTAFQDAVINGDTAIDENGFDGLDKALAGSSTEVNPDTATDWTSIAFGNDSSFLVLDAIDNLLGYLDGSPSAIFANKAALAKIRAAARRSGAYTRDVTTFIDGSQMVERYGNVTLVDLGTKAGSNTDIIPVQTRDLDNTVYLVTVTGGPAGGTFSLNVTINGVTEETAAIAYNATAATVQAAIRALSVVPADSPTVTGSAGGAWTVTFAGALADEVVTVALSDNNLTGGTSPSVTTVEQATTTNTANLTDIYAVRLGLDGFHGVSVTGSPLVKQWLPDFSTAGAVKTGEVEMGPVAVALKATKAAAVLRNVRLA